MYVPPKAKQSQCDDSPPGLASWQASKDSQEGKPAACPAGWLAGLLAGWLDGGWLAGRQVDR